MQRRLNVFSFLLTRLMTICKPCLEKSLKDSNKICQIFERIPYNSYFGKYLKYGTVDSKEEFYHGITLQQGCKPTTFLKKTPPQIYFWSLSNFFRIDIKSNSLP